MEFLILIALVALLIMVGGLRGKVSALDATLRKLEERLSNFDGLPAPPQAQAAGIPGPVSVLDPEPQAAPPPPPPPVEKPAIQAAPAFRDLRDQVSEPLPPPEEDPKPWGSAPEAEPEPATPEGGGEEPPPSPPRDYGDFERRFGTQWVVWIGGLALALGGIFLVRYSIEAGLFTPGLRIIFGAILALFLVGLGELARRREIISGISQINSAHIPSILTAAGTTIAYADVWAAYALYNFLSPGAAFVLLGLVALATLAAALVHGPGLAGLGLVGAYVTPALVGSTQPNYWALYVYLAVVTAAAYALARVRLWRWLAITAAVLLAVLDAGRHLAAGANRAARVLCGRGLRAGLRLHRRRFVIRAGMASAGITISSPAGFSPATCSAPFCWCSPTAMMPLQL